MSASELLKLCCVYCEVLNEDESDLHKIAVCSRSMLGRPMKKRKGLPVKARMSTYCVAPRSSTLLSERGHMTCSCGWTTLLSKMKQLGESNFVTIHFIHYVTVWGVEPVVTHRTSWLESTGVPGTSSAMKQPGESDFWLP